MLTRYRRIFQLHIAAGGASDDVLPVGDGQAHAVAQHQIAPDFIRVLDLPQRADRTDKDHQRQQWEHEAHNGCVPRPDERFFRQQSRQSVEKLLQSIIHVKFLLSRDAVDYLDLPIILPV